MRPQRIAFVCADPGVPIFGTKGCSIHAQEVLRGLLRRGARIDLFAARVEGPRPADLEALRVVPLGGGLPGDLAARELALIAANRTLRDRLAEEGPYDLIYERHALWSHAAMEHAANRGIPGLLEVNAPLVEEQSRHRGLHHRDVAEECAHRAFRNATALLAVSDEVAGYLRPQVPNPAAVRVVPNGVDPARFPERRPAARRGAPWTVGFVGTLKPWHGVEILLEAFGLLRNNAPEARLCLIGDGPERSRLEARVAAAGIVDHVEFTGAIPPEMIPARLAALEVAVAPYPALENFYFSPLKVYEYMAASLPVVASDLGQLGGLIRHGVDGWLVPAGDPRALAQALGLLHADPALRNRLGAEARATILRGHTWDHVVDRILRIAATPTSPRPLPTGVSLPGPVFAR